MRMRHNSFRAIAELLMLWLAGAPAIGGAAVLYSEDFNSNLASTGWEDRDFGEMQVTWNSTFGDSAGSLQGRYATQGFPAPQTDAWHIDGAGDSANYMGNYWTPQNLQGFYFDFYSSNAVPSDMTFRLSDGTNTFQFSLTPQLGTTNAWTTVYVPLNYDLGWYGGSEAAFSNALTSVQFIEIQTTRSGSANQYYFIDNFTLSNEVGLFAVIPEPNHLGLLALASWGMTRFRRLRRAFLE